MPDTPGPGFVRSLLDGLGHAENALDDARHRLHSRFGLNRPRHINAYRGWGDTSGVQVSGRVLADPELAGPGDNDSRWTNLRSTWTRFASAEVPHEPLQILSGTHRLALSTDREGYYHAHLPGLPDDAALWSAATVSLADGSLATPQPILRVHSDAGIGVISDIDDTLLESSITDWKVAAQLTFLQNARTRKPLKGAAKLYQGLQSGIDGTGRVPLFYVSSSPWNLYDLLDDFMELNAIPFGPLLLRDFGIDPGKFIKSPGHGHKLDRVRELINRFPHLRWVLLGDSGQADPDIYAHAAEEFGDRIAAIYIRDVDPDIESARDIAAGAQIERVAGTRVPMVLARDSRAIGEHAAGLGLLDPCWLDAIQREVQRDADRPTLAQAATDAAIEGRTDAPPPGRAGPVG